MNAKEVLETIEENMYSYDGSELFYAHSVLCGLCVVYTVDIPKQNDILFYEALNYFNNDTDPVVTRRTIYNMIDAIKESLGINNPL